MARKKVEQSDPGPACSPTVEQQQAAVDHLAAVYEDHHLEQSMALLHNRFVAFIAESRLPLPQVLLVLQMLTAETVAQAKMKYGV